MSDPTIGRRAMDAMEARLQRVEQHIDGFSSRFEGLDKKVDCLNTGVDSLKVEMANNTEVTTQVHDILTSFKTLVSVTAGFAKWGTAIGAFVMMVVHMWQKFTGKA